MHMSRLKSRTLRTAGWQWRAAEWPVPVHAVVYARNRHELMSKKRLKGNRFFCLTPLTTYRLVFRLA
jgi:hypothetical protein